MASVVLSVSTILLSSHFAHQVREREALADRRPHASVDGGDLPVVQLSSAEGGRPSIPYEVRPNPHAYRTGSSRRGPTIHKGMSSASKPVSSIITWELCVIDA